MTAGDTLAEVQALAGEVLAFHAEGLIEDGVRLPEPSSLDAVMASSEHRDAAPILVPLQVPIDRVVHVDIVLAEHDTETIDRHASMLGLSRAGVLVRAAKHVVDEAA